MLKPSFYHCGIWVNISKRHLDGKIAWLYMSSLQSVQGSYVTIYIILFIFC